MSLYRHVGSTGGLYVLVRDVATAGPRDLDTAAWHDGLRRWTVAQRATYDRYPWRRLCRCDRDR